MKPEASLIEQLCQITGAPSDEAVRLLNLSNNNLELAVHRYLEGVPTAAEASAPLIEEYVRPPILPKRETLVDPSYELAYRNSKRKKPRTVFDGLRDFAEETKIQEELLRGNSNAVAGPSQVPKSKKTTLAELFRQPFDLLFNGSFEMARQAGKNKRKWLLVNIQQSTEFKCQVLNRDVWSDKSVKKFVKEHFVFWQVYRDSEEGERFNQFYPIEHYPYIAVIDPVTGAKKVSWDVVQSATFLQLASLFLSKFRGLSEGDWRSEKKRRGGDRSHEDDDLEKAIKASLLETTLSSTVCTVPTFDIESDDDSDILETFDDDDESNDVVELPQLLNMSRPLADTTIKSCKNVLSVCSPPPKEETWLDFVGPETGTECKIALRLPEGPRDVVKLRSTSKLMALIKYAESIGFGPETYKLIGIFPKRQLSDLDHASSLESVGLKAQETVYIEKR